LVPELSSAEGSSSFVTTLQDESSSFAKEMPLLWFCRRKPLSASVE
jgi:hypothetical protein